MFYLSCCIYICDGLMIYCRLDTLGITISYVTLIHTLGIFHCGSLLFGITKFTL